MRVFVTFSKTLILKKPLLIFSFNFDVPQFFLWIAEHKCISLFEHFSNSTHRFLGRKDDTVVFLKRHRQAAIKLRATAAKNNSGSFVTSIWWRNVGDFNVFHGNRMKNLRTIYEPTMSRWINVWNKPLPKSNQRSLCHCKEITQWFGWSLTDCVLI